MENTNFIDKELLQLTFRNIETLMPEVASGYREKAEKISSLLKSRFDEEFCRQACVILHAQYKILPNRSRELLEERIRILFGADLSDEEVSKVLNIVVFDLEMITDETDIIARQLQANMGLGDETGSDDEVENPEGRFGYDVTNPVPLNGIDMINDYFSRLKFITGESVVFEREGSVPAENLPFPVDKYIVGTKQQKDILVLYVYAYHRRMSSKAPEGFKLIS